MADLSIVCVTKAEEVTHPMLVETSHLAARLGAELVIGLDEGGELPDDVYPQLVLPVHAAGYQETVQDFVIAQATGRYVLRIDDDETLDATAERWLYNGGHLIADHWCLRRAWLFGDPGYCINTAPHWPDHQTRLSTREKAQGHRGLHPSSPFGPGAVAPGMIIHHKLLIRTEEERESLCQHYDSIQQGAGMRHFYVPREVGTCKIASL